MQFPPPTVSAQQPPWVQAAAQAAAPVKQAPFLFTGTASEYFRIWIVNTLLTIITLGIYSAWAKVRTRQYFYRNTWVDGSSFDYLAKPIPILKGRIVAALALGALFAANAYNPAVYLGLLFIFVLLTPWVVAASLAFNARNSAYRNIRFAFAGRAGEAVGLYLGAMAVALVTCGLGYPYTQWRFTRFFASRHLFGELPFQWTTTSGAYFRTYLIAFAIMLPAYALLFAFIGVSGNPRPKLELVPLMLAFFYLYLLIPSAYVKAQLGNLLYGGLFVGRHTFVSQQRTADLLRIYAVNLVAIIVSLGLLIPWAKIRLAQYRASTLTAQIVGELRAQSLLDHNPGAVGAGFEDLGDMDLGIGA
jgi:uncharacterized membrane protein YjgN (DUF898 family)